MNDNQLLIAGAIAVGIGIWALRKPLTDLTGPVGRTVDTVNDTLLKPVGSVWRTASDYQSAPYEFGAGLLSNIKLLGDDNRWLS